MPKDEYSIIIITFNIISLFPDRLKFFWIHLVGPKYKVAKHQKERDKFLLCDSFYFRNKTIFTHKIFFNGILYLSML